MSDDFHCCGEDFELGVYRCGERVVLKGGDDLGAVTLRLHIHQAREMATWILTAAPPDVGAVDEPGTEL